MKTASKPGVAPTRQSKEAGFTLIELMVTIMVLGILASLAVPSFREFIANQRVKTTSYNVMAMLTLAQSEAIKRNTNTKLSTPLENNKKILRVAYGSPAIALSKQEIPAGISISIGATPGTSTTTCSSAITYSNNGRPDQGKFCSVQITSTSSNLKRCISVGLSGRPTVKNTAC